MYCLGIETSCDDTSLAVVRDGTLLGQATSSQTSLHALFGGVVPEMASREHARYIGPLCDRLLKDCGLAAKDIDVVAVARGPGLLGSLLVGVAFAKAFACGLQAGFIGVNHLHAHLMVTGLEREMRFPCLGLLVSGGHTHLYRIESPLRFILLGKTLDDAAGEAFDKAGKMLGLPYPAGRHIDMLADRGTPSPTLFPRPYLDNDSLDFSFSGLKTSMAGFLNAHPEIKAAWNALSGEPELPAGERYLSLVHVCASYRLAIVDTLETKTERALSRVDMRDVKSLLLAGGVAANALLRKRMRALAGKHGKIFHVPSKELCTDNGGMIAYLGWLLAARGCSHRLDMEAIPRGRHIPDDMLGAV